MNIQEPDNYYYPNKLGRIILLSIEEVIGRAGLIAVLNAANLSRWIDNYPPNNLEKNIAFEEMSRIQGALESLYGQQGGHGLALRSGRASFKYGLREFGAMSGCSDIAFRTLPLTDRIENGASIFAQVINKYSDQHIRLEELPEQYRMHIDRCPICWDRKAEKAVCHLGVGAIQEGLYWLSGGKHFNIEETHCLAKGDSSCTFVVDKKPFD
jgi:predicted hydrocarbon binding protein